MSVGTLRLGSFLLHVVLYDVYVVGRERRYLEAGIFSCSEVPTTHTPFSSQRGGACRKVFDHIHDYGFKKKQLNLRASGLGNALMATIFYSAYGMRTIFFKTFRIGTGKKIVGLNKK